MDPTPAPDERPLVLVANSGPRALELAGQTPRPELVLLDVMMPTMDGYEVLARLQGDPATRALPVVFLTALDGTQDEERGLARGAVDYVTKPVDPAVLLARVKTHVELHRARQALAAHGEALERRVEERTRQLEVALRAAQAATRARSEFLTNMSHELRTPMNGLLGMLDLALELELGEEAREDVGLARGSAGALMGLLNDVVDFAAADGDAGAPTRVAFSPAAVVAALRDLFAPTAVRAQLAWTVEPSPALPPAVVGDAARLRQVLLKLLDNAFKFTARGAVTLTASAAPGGPGEVRLRFEVRDTGVGVAPEQVSSLFLPFTQADGSSKRRFGGAGLGLALAQRQVQHLGGALGYMPAPGGGACFWVELPVGRPATPT